MASGFFAGAADPLSEEPGSFEAAVKYVNATGGIHGHKIALTLCNDQNNPNVAQGCAIKAKSNKDVAVLTSLSQQSSAVLPTLNQAGIPYVGDLAQLKADVTLGVAFPSGLGSYDSGPAIADTVVASGCTKAAVIVLDAGAITTVLENGFDAGLAAKNIDLVDTIVAPIGTPSYTSDVAAAVAKGAQCIIGATLPTDTVALMTAIQQAGNGLFLISFATSLPALSSLGTLGAGTYFMGLSRTPTDRNPQVQAVDKLIKKYSPGTPLTSDGLMAFAAVLLLKDGLLNVKGSVYTAATVRQGLNGLKNASTDDIFHPYTAKKLSSTEPRQFNPYALTYKITGPGTTTTVGNWNLLPGF
jgi:ABC-type branched-subunit amino acid transport system substrate-binding protein